MGSVEIERGLSRPIARDLRGILLAICTALAMWGFLIIGFLGLALKILH